MDNKKSLKVLLIDDCPHVREMIELALSSTIEARITFLHTENSADAISILTSNDIDLIISELDMPGGNGFELLSSKRQLGISAPIIIFSSSTKHLNKKLLTLGADAFFLKSQGIEELMNLVSKYLDG